MSSDLPTDASRLAIRRVGTQGPAIMFVHGNSCSSRCFERQLSSDLADRFRLVALDLPGHGDSPRSDAPDRTYTLAGYADAVTTTASDLELDDAVFVGWSLGGHILLEAAPRLPRARGILTFGSPPLASAADIAKALTPDPAGAAGFRPRSSEQEILSMLALFFRSGQAVPRAFFDDFLRTDPTARGELGASLGRNEMTDEVRVVSGLKCPLAVLHGAEERVVNRAYLEAVRMPTLWRGAIQEVPEAGHAAQWEAPEVFNRLLEQFVTDCNGVT